MKFNTAEEAIEYLHREVIEKGLETLIRKWEKDSPDAGYGYDSETWIPELLAYLHSQGVVLKVPLPRHPSDRDYSDDDFTYEPLIGEKGD